MSILLCFGRCALGLHVTRHSRSHDVAVVGRHCSVPMATRTITMKYSPKHRSVSITRFADWEEKIQGCDARFAQRRIFSVIIVSGLSWQSCKPSSVQPSELLDACCASFLQMARRKEYPREASAICGSGCSCLRRSDSRIQAIVCH